jgi:two-component system OmpR family response regulator
MRILLVEDEDEVANVLWRKLKQLDFAVDRAECLNEARSALDLHRYSLTILDRRLPDGDGVTLVPDIRAVSEQTESRGLPESAAF